MEDRRSAKNERVLEDGSSKMKNNKERSIVENGGERGPVSSWTIGRCVSDPAVEAGAAGKRETTARLDIDLSVCWLGKKVGRPSDVRRRYCPQSTLTCHLLTRTNHLLAALALPPAVPPPRSIEEETERTEDDEATRFSLDEFHHSFTY